MATVDELRVRISELNAHSTAHKTPLQAARLLINDGDLDGAEALIDAVEQAMHPAGGGTARSEVCLTLTAPVTTHDLTWVPFGTVVSDPDGLVIADTFHSGYSGNEVPADSAVELNVTIPRVGLEISTSASETLAYCAWALFKE